MVDFFISEWPVNSSQFSASKGAASEAGWPGEAAWQHGHLKDPGERGRVPEAGQRPGGPDIQAEGAPENPQPETGQQQRRPRRWWA